MVAPDGGFAAYIGIPYDEPNRYGIFEPVCTHPDHQRKGLARALMAEGLLRLRALGAVDVTVDTGDMAAANAFYTAMGFTEACTRAIPGAKRSKNRTRMTRIERIIADRSDSIRGYPPNPRHPRSISRFPSKIAARRGQLRV
jgi:N-acetylglutamate synthase-like GNAT family acetyltransferase